MASKEDEILTVLKEDLMQLEDIHACMLVRRNLEGLTPITEKFKQEIVDTWDVLKETMNEFLDIIEKNSKYGLDKAFFELGNYDVIFYILPQSDTALVAVVPLSANRPLIMDKLDVTRKKILKIIET